MPSVLVAIPLALVQYLIDCVLGEISDAVKTLATQVVELKSFVAGLGEFVVVFLLYGGAVTQAREWSVPGVIAALSVAAEVYLPIGGLMWVGCQLKVFETPPIVEHMANLPFDVSLVVYLWSSLLGTSYFKGPGSYTAMIVFLIAICRVLLRLEPRHRAAVSRMIAPIWSITGTLAQWRPSQQKQKSWWRRSQPPPSWSFSSAFIQVTSKQALLLLRHSKTILQVFADVVRILRDAFSKVPIFPALRAIKKALFG